MLLKTKIPFFFIVFGPNQLYYFVMKYAVFLEKDEQTGTCFQNKANHLIKRSYAEPNHQSSLITKSH